MTSPHDKVQILEIIARNADQRLDNYLLSQLKGVPKSRIYKLLRSGQVRVNKGRKKPSYRVQLGDLVRIPPIRISERKVSEAPQYWLDQVQQSILLEDSHVMVLNKPAGIAVHSGSNIAYGVIETLRQLRPDDQMLELVHRLDRDTSGCLVIAKSRSALNQLHEQFRDHHRMEKIYRAILVGRWPGGEKLIDAPLRKNTLQGGERMVMVDETGKPAQSQFTPLDYFDQATHMEIQLFTGRTHQIRVHAAHAGHPVAGDSKYGDESFNQHLKQLGLRRMFLHAHRLSFELDKKYDVTAPLDEQWQTLLKTLANE
ncbi:MAG: RluA family pseudouridine synthase [Gammaproteobacteria bacterium]|nr:RluA family pseudouridine synthase [Gammaproteobacteria bacterium]